MTRLTIAAVVVAALGAVAIHAQETRSDTLLTTEHWLDWERVSDAQISPDSARVVYTRQVVNKIEDKWESSLWTVNADGSQNRFLVKGSAARWSPDGKRLLYTAEGEPKGSQLFVRWVDVDGPATQITRTTETPRGAKWSPDGKWIAFSMFTPEQERWPISIASEPKGAKWTPAPRIVDTLHFRQDQVGFLEDGNVRLYVVPSDGGTPREMTGASLNLAPGELRGAPSLDWTPDSQAIVFNATPTADGDLKYQSSSLYVKTLAPGEKRDLVVKPGVWTNPVVSPDGKLVACTMTSPGRRDLAVVPFTGGEPEILTADIDGFAYTPAWSPDGRLIAYSRWKPGGFQRE